MLLKRRKFEMVSSERAMQNGNYRSLSDRFKEFVSLRRFDNYLAKNADKVMDDKAISELASKLGGKANSALVQTAIKDELAALKNNVKIGVNSNKYDSAVKQLCDKYFGSLVSLALGESLGCPRKPDPTGVNKILAEFGCSRENALYAGDSLVDIQTAKNAGIKCISVSWGYCGRDVLELNNKYIADSADELLSLIKKILSV